MASTAITHETSTAFGTSVTGQVLPRASVVVRAFTTIPPGGYQHLMLATAAKLASQQQSCTEADEIVCDPGADDRTLAAATRALHASETARATLIDQVDRWAVTELAHSRVGMLHTETLGHLIDRLVTVRMRGQVLASTGRPVADPQVRLAREQLGELCTAYDHLVTDLVLRRRRLPVYQTPTGPAVRFCSS